MPCLHHYQYRAFLSECCSLQNGTMSALIMEQMIGGGRGYQDKQAVGWMVEIASALDNMHKMPPLGMVHRDIKLENMMLQKEDGKLVAKLVDFGLSKVGD